MTELSTVTRRLNGTYDHWKKWQRLRKALGNPGRNAQRGGRRHGKHLRSAIAHRFWIMRSRRMPFTIPHD